MKADRQNPLPAIVAILTLAAFQQETAYATDVFTWQDDDGVTHYSQWPPEHSTPGDDGSPVSVLIVNAENPPDYDPADDPYSIRNQAQRMNAVWRSVEERRESRRKRKQEERAQIRDERYTQVTDDSYLYYARPWYRPPQWPGHGPGFGPRPPGHRPPHLQRPRPVTRPDFAPDPMRSAHIGVRRHALSTSPSGIE